MAQELKPLKGPGGFITDSNFDKMMFTKSQALSFAKNNLKRSLDIGCKKTSVKDYGDYFVYSVW